VLLPEAGRIGAVALAEKLRRMIEAEHIEHKGAVIPVTVSLGVAEFDAALESAEALFKLADDKLYEAKRSGRNQVRS
jgi:diguanylate cyclase (GGDEF)-like protein